MNIYQRARQAWKAMTSALLVVAVGAALALPILLADSTYAIGLTDGVDAAKASDATIGSIDGANGAVARIVDVLLFVIGAVAVVMIIVGGIRYVTSNGDQNHVKAAKDTILYAVIGLVVAILAYAIVRLITNNIK